MLRDLEFCEYELVRENGLRTKRKDQVFKVSETVSAIVKESNVLSFFVLEKTTNGFVPIAFYDGGKERLWALEISDKIVTINHRKEVYDQLQKDVFGALARKVFAAKIIIEN